MPSPPPESYPQQRITHCAICQYELTDQPNTYIPEYHLIATRCPECGQQQPAGITTQPWRYRKLKYALMLSSWVVLLLVTVLSLPVALANMSQHTAFTALRPFTAHISDLQAQSDPQYHVSQYADWSVFDSRYELNSDWWIEVGRDQAKKTFDPAIHINWIVFSNWLWFLVISPPIALMLYALLRKSSLTARCVLWTCTLLLSAALTQNAITGSLSVLYINPRRASWDIAAAPLAWSTFAFGALTTLIAYALTPRLLKIFKKHFRNVPIE
jgi:hypothetical protein